MTVLRACLDCGTPSPWTRCALHRTAKQRVRTANRSRARTTVQSSPRCVYCGSTRDLTSDHVQPLARGGSNSGAQVTACRPCNSSRGGRLAGNEGRGPQ